MQQHKRVLAVTPPILLILLAFSVSVHSQRRSQEKAVARIPQQVLITIIKAEDERHWGREIGSLLGNSNAQVRMRASLAAGRIGNEGAVSPLSSVLSSDKDENVRATAAFALGEIESGKAAEILLISLKNAQEATVVRARAAEALGKIAAALPKSAAAQSRTIGAALLDVLNREGKNPAVDNQLILLSLTAVLRARPEGAGNVIAPFLHSSTAQIRADAANALARLRAKDGNAALSKLLTDDSDPIVRANAARVLGATEERTAFDALLERALNDRDTRVRVSAIRALGTLKDQRAFDQLIKYAGRIKKLTAVNSSELLEIASSLGRILQGTGNVTGISWLKEMRSAFGNAAPDVDIALVRVSPEAYLETLQVEDASAKRKVQETILLSWQAASTLAQALGEISTLPDTAKNKKELSARAENLLRAMLDYRNSGLNINTLVAVHSEYAIPDVLRAFAAFKPADLAAILREQLKESDVVVRATAAELLGELPPDESNTTALISTLPIALKDQQLNDAALGILEALSKQKSSPANAAIKSALISEDNVVRTRAVALLKANEVGDFSSRIITGITRNTIDDYKRAILRMDKAVRANVITNKGSFTIELLPEEAPLNVDNFIQLAKRGYFNGLTFHRVVPNFVIQGGDPRGDGNGGPGYQIRCEINEVSYERGTVGMALSGKDTGGSQWFVTHSPQPHLDGGYTVFGRVITGMPVVDAIARGDVIRSITITEVRRRRS